MEFKDVLPILGVAIGWGLSELGGAIKARVARTRAIRKSITALYKLNFEMLQIKMAQEFYKNNNPSSLAEWERGRQRSFEQYSDVTNGHKIKIDESISLISQEYPLLAFRLEEAINKYNFIRNRKLDSFVQKQEVYMKMLSGFELGQIASQHIVEKTIFKLAFKVDFLLWVQLKLDTRNFKKTVKNGDLVHSSQIFGGKKSNKSSQQDAASGASA